MCLGEHQAPHQAWVQSRGQQRRQPPERLTDQHNAPERTLADRTHAIGDMRRPRHVSRSTLRETMTASIHGKHPVPTLDQPACSLRPLAGVPSKPMQQHDRQTRPTKIEARRMHPVPLEINPPGHAPTVEQTASK
jgi:hypothetical protein